MKKHILIFSIILTALGLTAFGINSWDSQEPVREKAIFDTTFVMNSVAPEKVVFNNPTNFLLDIGTRFSPIKKEELATVKSIYDIFDAEELKGMVALKSLNIFVFKHGGFLNISEIGYSDTLTEAQLKLIQSLDYSSNFSIRADFQKANGITGALENNYADPHLTIVPEKQVEYSYGKSVLLDYLRKNNEEAIALVQKNTLRPAKLFFTVTKKGNIENIRLDNHSGYPEIDKKMMELIFNTSGTWKPAENKHGEKVNQELVISFGAMGC